MGTFFYGYIKSTLHKGNNIYLLHELNCQEIDKLTNNDEWPFLVKNLFNITKTSSEYKDNFIIIGGSFKDLDLYDPDLQLWLDKIEKLLSKMYFNEAIIYGKAENKPDFIFKWDLKSEYVNDISNNNNLKFFNFKIKISNNIFNNLEEVSLYLDNKI
ncbi:MAG: hypothetical protein U0457_18310 [Candidatus Sericytochromatia bacterium]